MLTIFVLRCKWTETNVVTNTVCLVLGESLTPHSPLALFLLLLPSLPGAQSSELCLMTLFSLVSEGRHQQLRRDGGPVVSRDTATPSSARRPRLIIEAATSSSIACQEALPTPLLLRQSQSGDSSPVIAIGHEGVQERWP